MVEWVVENPASLKHNNSEVDKDVTDAIIARHKSFTPLIPAIHKNLLHDLGHISNRELERCW